MKCWCTMPMPAAMASLGDWKCAQLAVDVDGAGVGLVHAVQRLHQRRLAGAVLADDRVDGAGADVEVDVVVGDHAGNRFSIPTSCTARRVWVPIAPLCRDVLCSL